MSSTPSISSISSIPSGVGEQDLPRPESLISTSDQDHLIAEAAGAVRRLAGDAPRPLAIIAGSGLVGLAGVISLERRIPPDAVPHLPLPSVLGHHGGLLVGRIGSLGTMFFAGRAHLYEGWTPEQSVFTVHLAARLGAKILLATNATGGINAQLRPGDLVLLTDQINLTFRNLPVPPHGPNSPRANPHEPLYDSILCKQLREAARCEKISLKDGIYAGMLGPSYETRAESAMLDHIGADVVGMSTVGEILAARRVGLRTIGLSCVANMVPQWGQRRTVTHAEVLDRVSVAVEQLKRLIVRWAKMISDSDNDANR
jgi:purine-nucleoside phosphorylase